MALTPPVRINHKRLSGVRKRLGMSEEAAAKKIGVDLAELRSWEAGTDFPSFGKLRKIASVFKRPTSFFLENLDFKEIDLPSTDFRIMDGKKSDGLSPEVLECFRAAVNKRQLLMDGAEYLEIPALDLPFNLTVSKSAEEYGAELASRMQILNELKNSPYSAGHNLSLWRKKVEGFGVLVFQMKLGEPNIIRGTSLFFQQLPIIILNSRDEISARVFTLLHELCHLLLNTGGICNVSAYEYKSKVIDPIEVYCNRFAASVLVPQKLLVPDPGIDLNKFVSKMAKRFGVSQFVILRRLYDLKVINEKTYDVQTNRLEKQYLEYLKKKQQQDLSNYRRNIVRESISENGHLYLSMMFKGYRRDVFGMNELSEGIGAKSKHFDKIRKQMNDKKD